MLERWAGAWLPPLGRRGQAGPGAYAGVGWGGPAGQAVERTAERGQRLPRDPEIPRGGIERLPPQPQLDRPDSAPRVQQGRRTTRPQRLAPMAGRAPCGPLRVRGDCLGGAERPRRVGSAARKSPRDWPGEAPGGAQCSPQAAGEEGRAVRAPCARLDPEQPAVTCTVRARQADDVTDTPARGRGRQQETTVPRVLGARAQALECRDAQAVGRLRQRRPRRQVQRQRRPSERRGREKAPATGHLVPGTPGAVAVHQQRGPGAAQPCGVQWVGGAMGARRSARRSSDVGRLGLGGQPFEVPLGDPLGTSRRQSRAFACSGEQTCAPPGGAMTERLYAMGRDC